MSLAPVPALSLLGLSPTEQRLEQGRPWLLAAVELLHPLPPLVFVLELGLVLSGEELGLHGEPPAEGLAEAWRSYRTQVSARWQEDRRRRALQDAFARLPPSDRAYAVATLASMVLARLEAGLEAEPVAPLRRFLQRPAGSMTEAMLQASEAPEVVERARAGLSSLARAARRLGPLFREQDVLVLERLSSLRTPADRLALEQVAEALSVFERQLPRRMRSRRVEGGSHHSTLEDESSYPTGGFSSLSNAGPIENLVPSELAYIEEGSGPDLFDVRFATHELLKYTRDESQHRRRRRRLRIELDPSLDRLRDKDRSDRWQRLVTLVGLLLAVCRRLLGWWGEDEVRIELGFGPGLDEPRRWVRLLLHDELQRGRVAIDELVEGESDRLCLREAEGALLSELHGPRSATERSSAGEGLDGWLRLGRSWLAALV